MLAADRRLLSCRALGCLTGLVLVLVAGLGGAGAFAASALSPAGPQPQRLTIPPHSYYRHLSVHDLVWTNWGQPLASAQGTFTFQFCVTEGCSVSPFYDEPVVVTLSAVKRCRSRPYYSKLALAVNGPTPDSSFKGFRMSLGSCSKKRSSVH